MIAQVWDHPGDTAPLMTSRSPQNGQFPTKNKSHQKNSTTSRNLKQVGGYVSKEILRRVSLSPG